MHEQVFDSVLSRRAQTRLQDFYATAPALPENASLMVCTQRGKILWWTFAGSIANAVLAAWLKRTFG